MEDGSHIHILQYLAEIVPEANQEKRMTYEL